MENNKWSTYQSNNIQRVSKISVRALLVIYASNKFLLSNVYPHVIADSDLLTSIKVIGLLCYHQLTALKKIRVPLSINQCHMTIKSRPWFQFRYLHMTMPM